MFNLEVGAGDAFGRRLDSAAAGPIFCAMSVTRELRRRLSAERSIPQFDPCLPRSADEPPTGPGWIHEIKHDGFRGAGTVLIHSRGCRRRGRLARERGPSM